MADWNEIKVTIKTLSPVVMTAESQSTVMTGSRDNFTGSLLRGVMAAQYIQNRGLGKHAEEDDQFRRLFFGALRFVDAQPMTEGGRAIPVPLSVVKDKSGNHVKDLLFEKDQQKLIGYKPMKGLAYIREDGAVTEAEVQKNISLHMSRSAAKERITGRSTEGGIYNYESIDPWQIFEGAIIGEKKDLELLLKGLGDTNWKGRIGRSRQTGYGACEITLSNPAPVAPATVKGDTLYLRLETPFIPERDGAVLDGKAILQALIGKKIKGSAVASIYAAPVEMDRFVGIWRMRAPRRIGLAAGSVFALKKDGGWTKEDDSVLMDMIYGGLGEETVLGFGQMRLWKRIENAFLDKRPSSSRYAKEENKDFRLETEEAKRLVRQILFKRVLEKTRLLAEKDAKEAKKLRGRTHALSRLEQILGERPQKSESGLRKIFLDEAEKAVASGVVLKSHLSAIQLKNQFLIEWLKNEGNHGMPYTEDLKAYVRETIPESLKAASSFDVNVDKDDRIFYEYWLWFFRHGRKKSVEQRKEEE